MADREGASSKISLRVRRKSGSGGIFGETLVVFFVQIKLLRKNFLVRLTKMLYPLLEMKVCDCILLLTRTAR